MDKNTLSNYGWIVIAVLVLSVMIALATPFGSFIEQGVRSTTEGLFNTSQNAMNTAFGDLGVEVKDQTFEEGYIGGQPNTPKEFSKIINKSWGNITPYGRSVWTDGTNTYHSYQSQQYILHNGNWITKNWNITIESGDKVWTDGTNIYYSSGSQQYVLNEGTWEKKTWNENGYTYILGSHIWTDGTNIYYSCNSSQYVLNGDTWEPKTWTGLPDFNLSNFQASDVWTDGTNYYYSRDMVHRVLVK